MQRVTGEFSSPAEVLRAQGLAYIRFATQNPELYRIATMGEWKSGKSIDIALETTAFKHMLATVQTLMDEGVYPPDDPTTVALEIWTTAHGVAAMLIAKPHLPFGDAEVFADRVLSSVFCGRVVTGLAGPDAHPDEWAAWAVSPRSTEEFRL